MGAHADFWQVTSDSLAFALAAFDVADAALHENLMGLYRSLDAYEEAGATLDALKAAGLATAILSNGRPEEHTSELQSLMRISYALFCLKKKTTTDKQLKHNQWTTYDRPH